MVILAAVAVPTAGAMMLAVDPLATPEARLPWMKLALITEGVRASRLAGWSSPAARIIGTRFFIGVALIGLNPSARTTPWVGRRCPAARAEHPTAPGNSPETGSIQTAAARSDFR